MTQALVDPQLAAFYAANPEILQDPSILQSEPPPTHVYSPRERSEMELAVAFLVMCYAVSRTLATQPPPATEPAVVAGQAWRHHAPLWAKIAVPAIIETYENLPMSPTAKQQLAEDYAETLGDYLNESSAEALAAGFNQQIQAGGGGQPSWVRSVTAYGCDPADTRGIVAGMIASAKQTAQGPVSAVAKIAIQKARTARADLMGQTEARTASEAAKAVLWLSWLQEGRLDADATAIWETHEHEHDCPVCGPMDGVERAIDQPWVMPDGRTLWAACAHPHCKCRAGLGQRGVTLVRKDKGDDLYDRDPKGRFADREYRTRNVTHLSYADPEADQIAASVVEEVKNPFGVDMRPAADRNPFGAANPFKANPFAAAGNPFAANPFLPSENPFLAQTVDDTAAQARGRRKVVQHVFMGVKRQGPPPTPKTVTHYLALTDIDSYFYDVYGGEMPDAPNQSIDFDDINDWFTQEQGQWDGKPGERVTVSAFPSSSTWDSVYPQVEDLSDDDWRSLVTQAMPIWHESQHHADSILAQLTPADLGEIYGRAGYGYSHMPDPARIREAIATNIFDTNTPDRSLQEAYSDYVTWVRPELVGENGAELGHQLAARMGDSDWADFATTPRGAMVFDQGFHGGTSDLHGEYKIANVVYRSALADFGQDAPNGYLSAQELYMEPIGSWDPEDSHDSPYSDEDLAGEKHPWD